ncbi:MAG: hypothetical protein COA57_14865 [Flavobacteriales bacterium]|nr:MAG: hypothetical protein COA57_14865 [Flavobacteriales bacterium]
MADLAASAVTVIRNWLTGGIANKDQWAAQVSCALVAMGSATNKIPATAFGLTRIEQVSGLAWDETNSRAYGLTTDGTNVYVINLEGATDADRGNAVDHTTTVLTFTIKGYQ